MDAPVEYTLIFKIGADTDPVVLAALRMLAQRLHEGSTEGVELEAEPTYTETEFVTYFDLVRFLKARSEAKSVGQKAARAWDWLTDFRTHRGFKTHHLLLFVCPRCELIRGQCRCPNKVRTDSSTGKWEYQDYDPKDWKIGQSSLLAIDPDHFEQISVSARVRLLAFIDHLKSS